MAMPTRYADDEVRSPTFFTDQADGFGERRGRVTDDQNAALTQASDFTDGLDSAGVPGSLGGFGHIGITDRAEHGHAKFL
jgi:hypothetical protein